MNPTDPYDLPASETLKQTDSKIVPNRFPKITAPYRLAIIGEAPGEDEVARGEPFVGYSGRALDSFLSRFHILRDACFIGNICQHRPVKNQIASFDWDGEEIQGGIAQLKRDLSEWRPHLCLLLGNTALQAFQSPSISCKKHKDKNGWKFATSNSISDWRGSFFMSASSSPCPMVKCVSSYHPAACLRQYEWTPMLMLDIQRAAEEAKFPELNTPQRTLVTGQNYHELINELDNLHHKLSTNLGAVGTDIEGYWNNISCISFAPTPDYSVIVPFTRLNGLSYWSVDEEVQILRRVIKILTDPRIDKVWQNGLYDRFCWQYGQGVVVKGRNDDIMLAHWERYSELGKSLADQTSLFTKEPYYKFERKSGDLRTYHEYCCKDSAVTIELHQKHQKWLEPSSKKHYEFNLTLLNALLYMECRGIKYDKAQASRRLTEVDSHIYELQYQLDALSGRGFKGTDKTILRALVRDVMCFKRNSSQVKADYKDCYDLHMRILHGDGDLTPAQIGRLSTDLGMALNTKSAALKTYLYKELGFPEQYNDQTGAVTTDYLSLIGLRKKRPHPALDLIIDIGELRTRAQMLHIEADPDGRVRAGYNIVGSETGRVTCYTSPTGSGYALQTIPDENELKKVGHPLHRGMRDLLVADNDCYLAKCDLKGADGWTIGANLAALGNSTMLDDLRFGLKPAALGTLELRHGDGFTTGKSREELAKFCGAEVKKSDWDYFAMKGTIWGMSYLMGVRKAVSHIFEVSEGTVLMKEADMERFKAFIFRRYGLSLWHRHVEREIARQPYPPKLHSPSGHIRKFFGRRADVLGEWLAHEPQSVTTYATNSAMFRLWTDPENRYVENGKTKLHLEPLHQVHDEMVVQFHQSKTDWAKKKIAEWFSNPIRIAGIELTIPYDGAYGHNWAMNKESKVGTI